MALFRQSQELQPENEPAEPRIIEDVIFEQKETTKGEIFESSAPDRKKVVLSPDSRRPFPDRPYRVRVIEDTKPDDPQKGKLVVAIEDDEEVQMSPEEWKNTEGVVREAEQDRRQAISSSQALYKDTGVPKKDREEAGPESLLEKSRQPRVAAKALERELSLQQETEELLGEEDSPERTLLGLQRKNLMAALKEERTIEKERKRLIDEESALLRSITDQPSGPEQEALDEIRGELHALDKKRELLLKESPEAYYGLHLKELKEYKKDLQGGRIVETGYVREKIEDIIAHTEAGKPILLYGHLGSGKTELAMHFARERLGKEAVVLSGSKNTSLAELYGHQVLTLDTVKKEELDTFMKEVEEKFEEWKGEHADASLEDLQMTHDRILQTYLTQFKSGTISDFFLGPVYRAMEEGRPVIIDEVNAIPHEVLISLNHILTREIGDKVNVQQDSGKTITIKEGFCVLMTGNLNQGQSVYVDRQDMDPAFLSRLHKIEYDYLPQKTEGSLEEEAGEENELFHIMLARVMDRNGNIEAPSDAPQKLWLLAQAARVTQDVFAGKEIDNAFFFQQGGARPIQYYLKESVLSMRAIDDILTQWQKEGYKYELDSYIWSEFVSQSTVPSDRAYLYQLLKDRFGFFQGDGWEQHPNFGSGGTIPSFDVKPPQNKGEETAFFGPRDTVEFAYGSAPERAKWPVHALSQEDKISREIKDLTLSLNTLHSELLTLEQDVKEGREQIMEEYKTLEADSAVLETEIDKAIETGDTKKAQELRDVLEKQVEKFKKQLGTQKEETLGDMLGAAIENRKKAAEDSELQNS